MTEYREVNGQTLVNVAAWRLGDDYLITKAPGAAAWHTSYVTSTDGRMLTLELVDTWYELPDAVIGALIHRQSRTNNIVDEAAREVQS